MLVKVSNSREGDIFEISEGMMRWGVLETGFIVVTDISDDFGV